MGGGVDRSGGRHSLARSSLVYAAPLLQHSCSSPMSSQLPVLLSPVRHVRHVTYPDDGPAVVDDLVARHARPSRNLIGSHLASPRHGRPVASQDPEDGRRQERPTAQTTFRQSLKPRLFGDRSA